MFARALGNLVLILVGAGIVLFAYICFQEVPVVGTVFMVPGDGIENAKMSNLFVRYGLMSLGIGLVVYGIYVNTITDNTPMTKEQSDLNHVDLNGIKQAKELLDSGSISQEEYDKIKEKIIS